MASIMDGERQFHIRTIPDEVGRYVIMPGDPGRVPKIAALLDDAKQVAQNREYNVYTGYLDGEKVTDTESLNKIKNNHNPGDVLKMTVYKYASGKTETVEVTLSEQLPN